MRPKAPRWLVSPVWIKGLLLVVVILLVGGWRGFILWQTPRHLTEIARAHGYVGLMYGLPQASADGSKLVYSQMDEGGIGIFLVDLTSGHKELVHQKVSADDWFQNTDAWPWSPDGRHFIFTHTNLFVCDGTSGKVEDALPVEGVNGVATLTWLSATSFVYVSRAGNLHQIEVGEDHHWREIKGKHIKAGTSGLAAISEDIICWQKENYLWSLNLTSNTATVLFHAPTNRLEGFGYLRKSRQLLVNCLGKNGSFIQRMAFDDGALEKVGQTETATAAHQMQSLGGEKAFCAYIGDNSEQPDNRHVELLSKSATKPVKLFDQGTVDGITASGDGRKLFVVGGISNEPASSVWEYNADSGALRCVIPGLDFPSPYTMRVKPRQFTVNLGGRKFNYHVYEPAELNPNAHGKYPVVIGDTLFKTLDPAYQNRVHGPYWAPMLANEGAYVVIVERPGAWFNEMENWEEYVDWVYHKMLENPTIDPSQVYLYATSAETEHLSNLAQKQPGLWKGLILLNPGALPDLQLLSKAEFPPKILIEQGVLEGTNRVHQYQMAAMQDGVRVEYHTHENNAHILLGKEAMGKRAETMTKFVFGD